MIEGYLESTLLRPDADRNKIEDLCSEAIESGFYGVCINPWYVEYAASLLKGTRVKLVTVAGFPLGCSESIIKLREAEEAVKKGAEEIDMVINLAALKNKMTKEVVEEIRSLANAAPLLKVIVETGYLEREELFAACNCISEGGADFAKTSTGFGPRGASREDVEFLKSQLPGHIGIKAAGGIKTYSFAQELISAGAHRLGTSSAGLIWKDTGS